MTPDALDLGAQWRHLGVAVSGGSDSLALLHLLHERGLKLSVATVDHGLRAEARAEAIFVAEVCAGLGVPHERLDWTGWDGSGNLQDHARRARYRLLADWGRGFDAIALGHTLDDQAETFLMRLARQAGVDGLSHMDAEFSRDGARFLRPLMRCRRAALRDYLTARGQVWVDDPSNADERFDRVTARKVLLALEPLGIDAPGLAAVSDHMGSARAALEVAATDAARRCVRLVAGALVFDRTGLLELPPEIFRRLMVGALQFTVGSDYGPRADPVLQMREQIRSGKGATLHGCRVLVKGGVVWVIRELAAVRDLRCASDALWDGCWRFSGPHGVDLKIGALTGEGLSQCADWRETGIPREVLIATPAIWRDEKLISAPLVGFSNDWRVESAHSSVDYINSLISH